MKDELDGLMVREGVAEAWDDVSGAWLDHEMVRDARAVDMVFPTRWAYTHKFTDISRNKHMGRQFKRDGSM